MYTVVIADDQETIRRGLMNTIRKACPEITVAGVFKTGLEALDYISSHPVDLIIADINMPHKTGLDIAKHIYEHRLETKVILITGYKEFEYAKNAINYQVTYLLTKPFATAQLIECIRKIEMEIDRNNRIAFSSAKEYLNAWSLKGELLQLLYNGTFAPGDEMLRDKGFHKDLLLENLSLSEVTFSSLDSEPALSEQDIKDLGETEEEEYSAFAISIKPEKTVFLLFYACGVQPDFVHGFAENFVHSVNILHHRRMAFTCKSFPDIAAYLVLHQAEILEEEYFDFLQGKKFEEAKQVVDTLCTRFSGRALRQIFDSVTGRLTETFGVAIPFNSTHSDITDTQIRQKLLDLTAQAVKNFSEIHYIIMQVCDYVKENCGLPEMSLNYVADIFHINANYLGRVFKRVAGESFVDYLVKARVEKAKALLKKGNLEVQDIARAVGYNQVKYFRLVFKKHTGMTATQYAKMNRLGGISQCDS